MKKAPGRLSSIRNTVKKLTERLSDEHSEEGGMQDEQREKEKLLVQIRSLEDEVRRLSQARAQLEQAHKQNDRLTEALQEAKSRIEAMRMEVEKLTAPPASYGIYSSANDDETVNVYVTGRKLKVNLHPSIRVKELRKGQEVILNEALNVIESRGFDLQGEVVRLKDNLDGKRAVVTLRTDEERVAELAEPLLMQRLSVGDHLLFDARSGYLLEKLPKSEVEELVLEEVPDIKYTDIGGLHDQIEQIQDAVELPVLHPELFKEHKLRAPKGVLLYGPPGCGKTLIAKAVANSIAQKLAHLTSKEVRSFFLHVKGPELLNKYVGESERNIREVFKKAKEKADDGFPVIVFFDEMDALFRTRGSGISSDVESTIVPQFLSEIDGVERLRNVIVIGASNRQDLIDPAVLRPGRLDVKIKIDRPDKAAAKDIFSKYLTPDLPWHAEELAQDDDKETFYLKDFSSGALIEGIVSRAKKYAIKRLIANGERGIKSEDLLKAVRDEFKEHEDLPNTTNPDDWAKIAGKKADKIVNVRTITAGSNESRRIETVTTGHYL
ncbi:MAG: proteasome ATPase [Nitrospirae bacterium 13_2_20CM_2_61_4]|nr:MAG: proteasome ATPase [Nitrospirae bacterium 13_2_20CM_2_61_4]